MTYENANEVTKKNFSSLHPRYQIGLEISSEREKF